MQESKIELSGCDVKILDRIALEDLSGKVNLSKGPGVAIYKFKGTSFQAKKRINTNL